MGIALLALSGLFQGFSAFQRLTAGSARPAAQRPLRVQRMVRPTGSRHPVMPRPVTSISPPRPEALRVVRVCDSQATPGDVGRLVISGRMADVCAELDRLAEREAASTRH